MSTLNIFNKRDSDFFYLERNYSKKFIFALKCLLKVYFICYLVFKTKVEWKILKLTKIVC